MQFAPSLPVAKNIRPLYCADMSQFSASKMLSFCYGHRLIEYDGPCRHLHGHNVTAEIIVTVDDLDPQGMSVDFRKIKSTLLPWINQHLDHRLLLQNTDPLLPMLQHHGEPVFVMDCPPTAENIAQLLFEKSLTAGLPITQVKLWESDTSWASFGRDMSLSTNPPTALRTRKSGPSL